MAIKEKSVFKKCSYEYESPEGDKWDFEIIEMEDRKFIEFSKVLTKEQTKDGYKPTVIKMDGEMLLDMADAYRRVTSQISTSSTLNFQAPSVQDHRGLDRSEEIQEQVDKTMLKQDHATEPVQSLVPQDDFEEFRSGVDRDNQEEVPETSGHSTEGWESDITNRKNRVPVGSSGSVKRVGAGDII